MSEKAISDNLEALNFRKFSRSPPTMVAPRELGTHPLGHDQYFFASYATGKQYISAKAQSAFFTVVLWTHKPEVLNVSCSFLQQLTFKIAMAIQPHFVFTIISTFISQNPKFFFMHVLKKDVLLL